MSDHNYIHLDPVEDGKPSKDWIIYGGAVVLVAVGLLEMYLVGLLEGFDTILFAAVMILLDKSRRVNWTLGYYSCAESIAEQVQEGLDE